LNIFIFFHERLTMYFTNVTQVQIDKLQSELHNIKLED